MSLLWRTARNYSSGLDSAVCRILGAAGGGVDSPSGLTTGVGVNGLDEASACGWFLLKRVTQPRRGHLGGGLCTIAGLLVAVGGSPGKAAVAAETPRWLRAAG
ncbi:hypothetical protein JYU34_007511 [Plutella xylostella]|uniref:Uncharacterized protein n=1 Tax=Plutella xylostella TaxID=51655 RepID=A0ABQ7QQL7_PLUXY|nr:hypothetical protein JYU34_007511 [Plutella xylostella]